MNNKFVGNVRVKKGAVFFIVILLSAVFCLTGCEPLRKKFVRKKRQDQSTEVVPVLMPVEYPPEVYSAAQIYRQHYSLWQVWHKDLMAALTERQSRKSVVSILDHLQLQLESMQKLLLEEKQPLLADFLDRLGEIKSEYDKPNGIRNELAIISKAKLLDGDVRREIPFKKIGEYLNQSFTGE